MTLEQLLTIVGMSQGEFAESIGVGTSTLSNWRKVGEVPMWAASYARLWEDREAEREVARKALRERDILIEAARLIAQAP